MRHHPIPTRLILAVALLLAVTASACGSSSGSSTKPTTTAAAGGATAPAKAAFPVTVMSCGKPVTFTKAPTRAVSNDINLTEMMLALGLAPHMAGTFGVGDPMPAQYRAAFASVKHVSPGYFTLEPLVGLHPDFLFAGWDYGLDASQNLTPDALAKYGIQTYVLTESCSHVEKTKQSVSIDDTYTDLENLGRIFGVSAKADAVVAQMKAEVADAQAKVKGLAPKTVFLYDSGTASPFTALGLAMPNDLITRAGGTNVFGAVKQNWTSVSWEQVTKDQPACILINDYDTPTAAQKQSFLETSPITKGLPAVKDKCILSLTYDELTPGPRNADAVVAIAKWLHPEAFS